MSRDDLLNLVKKGALHLYDAQEANKVLNVIVYWGSIMPCMHVFIYVK